MSEQRTRIDSIDVLRGLVMVLMALDHARVFFSNAHFDPTNLEKTFPALFLTRWVTHFCAPVFFFLAGTGAYLSFSRGKSKGEISRFLLTRGIWLVILELTIVHFGWSFNWDPRQAFAGVIWALGWSMIVMAILVFLPLRVVGAIGVAMIVLHDFADPIQPQQFGSYGWLWTLVHSGGFAGPFFVLYVLIPWVGVMAAGYAFGAMVRASDNRARLFARMGLMMTIAFIIIRAINMYGDPNPWHVQKSAVFTVLSFINTWKYPPSLAYLLMTLGPAMLMLAAFEKWPSRAYAPLLVFGRVPLFYYVLHLPLLHGLAVLSGKEHALGLGGIYAAWLLAVIILYFPCRWFADLKARKRSVWLSYA